MKSYNFSCTIMAFQLVDHANSGASLVAHNANITKIHPNKKHNQRYGFCFCFFFVVAVVEWADVIWAVNSNITKCTIDAPRLGNDKQQQQMYPFASAAY